MCNPSHKIWQKYLKVYMAISHTSNYNSGMKKIGGVELDPEAFGRYVAKRREAVGYKTQKSLALALNKDISTIGKIETGDRIPSFELFLTLAEYLKIHPVTLLRELIPSAEQNDEIKEITQLLGLLPASARTQVKDYLAFLVSQHQQQS